MTFDRDTAREIFREAILAALDEAAERVFARTQPAPGASDGDLPRLFRAVDEQVEVLAERYGHGLVTGYVGTPRWRAERAELKALGLPLIDDEAVPS